MLRTLGSLDATLVELGENLGLAPTEDVPSEATLSAKPSESQEKDTREEQPGSTSPSCSLQRSSCKAHERFCH
jgi:hypothetical protein